MHKNLFAYGDRRDVYEGLQQDYKRDHRQTQVMDFILFAGVGFLARSLSGWDFAAVLAVAFVGLSRLNTFIDNSNRNFFMHMIDWTEARDYKRPNESFEC